MTLGELQEMVLRTIKRPELTQQALDAINAAIEYAAAQGDFAFDLVEGALAISSTAYAQSVTVNTEFPRFRKIKYLRPAGYRRYLKHRDPSKIFNADCEQTDVWYRAGTSLVFKLSNLQSSLLYGYFQRPDLLEDEDDENEYTLQMPYCIHDIACSRMYDDIGNDAESQRLERRGLRMLSAHKADKQDSVSHS